MIKKTNEKRVSFTETPFVVKPKRFSGESTITSMRMPIDMIKALDEASEKCGYSRNELLAEMITFCLDHIQIEP